MIVKNEGNKFYFNIMFGERKGRYRRFLSNFS